MAEFLPKAILLDLDDTILAFSQGALPCWQAICTRFACRIERITPEKLLTTILETRACFWADPKRHPRGRLNLGQARREIVAEALSRLSIGSAALADEIADAYASERDSTLRPFPGAIGTLRHLRNRGVLLALITNGEAESQRRKINRFGLLPLFDCILIEEEFGVGKPDERIYLHALDQLGVRPEEAWMVGDSLDQDVQAPQKLGILGIWLDFAGQGLPEANCVHPNRVIRSLAGLLRDQTAQ
jgi:putative hydrolase of the HAD superfamily